MKSLFLVFNFLILVPLLQFGCSSSSVDENNPESIYKEAEEDISDKRYLQALEKLRIVKNRFPYSKLSTSAALRIADVLYYEESYAEAAASYEVFRDLHPKHEKADYVLFQIGESYYNQMPSSEDRDLTPASKAIESYTELEKLFANSSHLPTAKEHSSEATEQLSQKERYVADFYFKRDNYESAATRYEKLFKNYANSKSEEHAMWRYSQCLAKLGRRDELKHASSLYESRFPNGKYSKKIQEL